MGGLGVAMLGVSSAGREGMGAGEGVGGGGTGVEGCVVSSTGSTPSPMPICPMTYCRTSLSVMIPSNRPFFPPFLSSS